MTPEASLFLYGAATYSAGYLTCIGVRLWRMSLRQRAFEKRPRKQASGNAKNAAADR